MQQGSTRCAVLLNNWKVYIFFNRFVCIDIEFAYKPSLFKAFGESTRRKIQNKYHQNQRKNNVFDAAYVIF